MTICGSVVLDICQHFVERWNEIKRRKVRAEWNDLPYRLIFSSQYRDDPCVAGNVVVSSHSPLSQELRLACASPQCPSCTR